MEETLLDIQQRAAEKGCYANIKFIPIIDKDGKEMGNYEVEFIPLPSADAPIGWGGTGVVYQTTTDRLLAGANGITADDFNLGTSDYSIEMSFNIDGYEVTEYSPEEIEPIDTEALVANDKTELEKALALLGVAIDVPFVYTNEQAAAFDKSRPGDIE